MVEKKAKDKKLIFLKSTVLALGIVFFILLFVMIIKILNKNSIKPKIESSCRKNEEIFINNEILRIIDNKKELILLTKPRNNEQELLILEKNCLSVISKNNFKIK